MVIEKDGTFCQSPRTSIKVLVKECSLGGGARVSKPHATKDSMREFPRLGAELAAAQQSRNTTTSDFDLSNKL